MLGQYLDIDKQFVLDSLKHYRGNVVMP